MRRSLVLTLLGPDRPGLVEAMAALIARHGGNWLESRMASLAGEFAGILRVEVDEDSAAELESALRSLEADQGLAILVKGGREHRTSAPAGCSRSSWSEPIDPGSCARSRRRWRPRASTSRSSRPSAPARR